MHRINNNVDLANMAIVTNPKSSIYVSASAGSGKTKLLIDRMLSLMLSHNGDLNKILCITYTKAAVQEIRERIANKALQWLKMPQTELDKELEALGVVPYPKIIEKANSLYRIMLNPESAPQIQTLHGFCVQSLNKGLSLVDSSQILSDHEARAEFFHSCYQTFARIKEANIPGLKDILHYYNELDLIDILYNLHKFYNKNHRNSGENTWYETVERFCNLPDQIEAKSEIIKQFFDQLNYEELRANIDIIPKQNNELQIFLDYVQGDNERNISEVYFALVKIFYTADDNPRKRKLFNRQITETHPQLETIFDSIFQRLIHTKEKIAKHAYASLIQNLAPISYLAHLEYKHHKLIANQIEYDDMIVHTIDLLNDTALNRNLSYTLDWSIDHVLIDEAQDLSDIQWNLIKLLVEEFYAGETSRNLNRTLFIVGDFKQSIFGFQGACPKVFLDINEYFGQKFNDAGKIWNSIELVTNFRSHPAIIEAVNNKFPDWPEHIAFSKQQTAKETSGIYQEIRLQNIEQLADLVASWLESKRYVSGLDRAITPQDIMILVRRHSAISLELADQLVARGISIDYSAYNDDASILLIDDIIAVLKFVFQPFDELNLMGLLKSPLIQLREDEIFDLAHERNGSIWDEFSKYQEQSHLDKSRRYQIAYHKLNTLLQAFKQNKRCLQFVAFILQYFSSEIAENYSNSYLVLSNLYQAIYNETNEINPSNIINIIKKFRTEVKERNSKYSPISSAAERVVFSTIHGAKGLEAPIVILLDVMLKQRDPYELVLKHDIVPMINAKYDFPELNAVKAKLQNSQNEEKKRLLYVGMTRARYELYIANFN